VCLGSCSQSAVESEVRSAADIKFVFLSHVHEPGGRNCGEKRPSSDQTVSQVELWQWVRSKCLHSTNAYPSVSKVESRT
jgi:hypothetical protein